MSAWGEAHDAPLPNLDESEEEQTRDRLRFALNVDSLSELKENKSAQRKFKEIREAYERNSNE